MKKVEESYMRKKRPGSIRMSVGKAIFGGVVEYFGQEEVVK